jgi:hypothetical protein
MSDLTGQTLREVDLLRLSLDGLRRDLPATWRWKTEEQPRRQGFDLVATLEAPDGARVTLLVEAKRTLGSRDVPKVLDEIRSRAAANAPGAVPLLVARYLSPAARERLEREDTSYADATGNRRLVVQKPALFVRNVGADRDPWRGPGRPRGTLKGAPAARVARWLVDFSPPYTVLQVAKGSGASTGATYRVVQFLDEEGMLSREPRGSITEVRWRAVIERWSRDYGSRRDGWTESLLFPRGMEALLEQLRGSDDLGYVLTGSLAARDLAPHAATRFAMLYATDVDAVIERLGLRRVDTGANVILARDFEGVGFVRARERDGLRVAAPSQIAVDLLTGPGRSPNEGAALLDWMEAHVREWRA